MDKIPRRLQEFLLVPQLNNQRKVVFISAWQNEIFRMVLLLLSGSRFGLFCETASYSESEKVGDEKQGFIAV